jgi:GNAT superfamily N-acetyltransferase
MVMNHVIETITFEEILPIWRDHLWPNRESAIEPNSAMCLHGGYDMYNMSTKPTFFAYKVDGKIAGVNSGHMCSERHYRSRGLFVFSEYRGMGIGTKLLMATIEQGRKENALLCWSYPRNTSWMTYHYAGFYLKSDYEESETGLNAYCAYQY